MMISVRTKAGRSAFTLIELLVVVFILVVLVTMTAGALFRMRQVQDVKRTENDMQKIHSGLDGQWKATIDLATKQQIPSAVLSLADNDTRRAKALWVKMNLKREFPASVSEAVSPINDGQTVYLQAHPTYSNAFSDGAGGFYQGQGSYPAAVESSACLYLALSTARGGATFNPESVGSTAITTAQFKGSKSGGTKSFQYFVDAWGQPIMFWRWNTQDQNIISELDAAPYTPQSALTSQHLDRDDPEGTLMSGNWSGSGKAATALNPISSFNPSHNFIPYLQSAGRNKSYADDDDIVSFRLRQQGNRGD